MASIAAPIPKLLTVSELAAYLSKQYSYDLLAAIPPIDVDKVAQLLKIDVSESPCFDLEDRTVGKITLENGKAPQIWINPLENSYAPRRRFTLAHELGHFCMHRSTHRHEFIDNRSSLSRNESYWNRYESEANNFAAQLLMPTKLIHLVGRQVINAYKAEHAADKMPVEHFVDTMATRFCVSRPAMVYRLKDMGIKNVIDTLN